MKGCFFLSLWIIGVIICFMLLGPFALPVLGAIGLLLLFGG
jgi:hypothetical protein